MLHPLDDNATRALLEQRHEKLARYGRPPRRPPRRRPLTALLRSLLARTTEALATPHALTPDLGAIEPAGSSTSLRSSRTLAVALTFAAVTLLSGCAAGASEGAPGEPAQAPGDVADRDGTPASAQGAAPRTTTYIGTRWTVEDARASSEAPTGTTPDDAVTYLYVTVAVENTLRDTALRLPGGLFHLRSPEGAVSRSEGLLTTELDATVSIEPGEVLTGDLVFEFERAVEPSDLTLTIQERGREPAVLPLSGDLPAPPHSTGAEIASNRATVTGAGSFRDARDVLVEPLGVDVGLDDGRRRSDVGTYFVFAEVRAHGVDLPAGIGASMFHLEVDGVSRSTSRTEGGNRIRPGEAIDRLAVFEVPLEAEQLVLVVGRPGDEQARFPIAFGAAPSG